MFAPTPSAIGPVMTPSPVEVGLGSPQDGLMTQPHFKKHKQLPRPPHEASTLENVRRRRPKQDIIVERSPSLQSDSQPASPRTLKHQSRRIGTGPDLPPTPPSHSRQSSNTHSTIPSSPTIPDEIASSLEAPSRRALTTPPDQRSPPTPDVTPPQPASRPRALKSHRNERSASKTTPSESRTESFTTAREEPASSGEDDRQPAVHPLLSSTSTSQTTVRRISDTANTSGPHPQALNLALENFESSLLSEDEYTPRTKQTFQQFDGSWGPPNPADAVRETSQSREAMSEETEPSHRRRPRRGDVHTPGSRNDQSTITYLKARARKIQMTPELNSRHQPGEMIDRGVQVTPSVRASPRQSPRRASTTSAKSRASTVVEAYVFDERPTRTQTLRHVRKQRGLRNSISSNSSRGLTAGSPASADVGTAPEHGRPKAKRQHDSSQRRAVTEPTFVGPVTTKLSSRVGGGKVSKIILPETQGPSSSLMKEPSLHSVFSEESEGAVSLASIPFDDSVFLSDDEVEELDSRRPRRYSETDPSDIHTIDFPPAIPRRTSSLSAPTSANPSRSNSLTGDAPPIRNTVQPGSKYPPLSNAALFKLGQGEPTSDRVPTLAPAPVFQPPSNAEAATEPSARKERQIVLPPQPEISVQAPFSNLSDKDFGSPRRFSFDPTDEALSTKKYSSRNTPFSITSLDTNWTAPEISEAQAVQMYPHQNSSVLIVDQSAKASEASQSTPRDQRSREVMGQSMNTTRVAGGKVPATPPQRQMLTDIESPLRNPRVPPEPPFIPPGFNFIPATPSGATPAPQRDATLGNFYEITGSAPPRKPSLLRRALTRRRHSVDLYPPSSSWRPGFLPRSLSLSRDDDKANAPRRNFNIGSKPSYPQEEDSPAEEHRLHPFWRPHDRDKLESRNNQGYGDDDEVYRYPPVNNRPHRPGRTLSARMKRTFAILPLRDNSEYAVDDDTTGPDRLTIKRTPSGNLRVARNSGTHDVPPDNGATNGRAVQHEPQRSFWKGHSAMLDEQPSTGRRRRSSIDSAVEALQKLPHRLSEKRRERRTQELRAMISAPRELRDGVGDVVRSNKYHRNDGFAGHI